MNEKAADIALTDVKENPAEQYDSSSKARPVSLLLDTADGRVHVLWQQHNPESRQSNQTSQSPWKWSERQTTAGTIGVELRR